MTVLKWPLNPATKQRRHDFPRLRKLRRVLPFRDMDLRHYFELTADFESHSTGTYLETYLMKRRKNGKDDFVSSARIGDPNENAQARRHRASFHTKNDADPQILAKIQTQLGPPNYDFPSACLQPPSSARMQCYYILEASHPERSPGHLLDVLHLRVSFAELKERHQRFADSEFLWTDFSDIGQIECFASKDVTLTPVRLD
ncbi:hypothetical protein F5146DRAFT_1001599 [Armillaria mellea]|nr:hypothetical protein F5146DRAFT_1001599 [Armillaria mellea]